MKKIFLILIFVISSCRYSDLKLTQDFEESEQIEYIKIPKKIIKTETKIENNQSISGVVGAKNLAESEVFYPFIRKIYSSAFRIVVRWLFSTDILDSQTGVKSFRRLDIDEILNICHQDGFIFDLELMILLIRNGKTIEYTPVTIQHQYNSSIKFLTPLIIFFDLLELRRKISI